MINNNKKVLADDGGSVNVREALRNYSSARFVLAVLDVKRAVVVDMLRTLSRSTSTGAA